MIVVTSKLQREITLVGYEDAMKAAVDTSSALKRLNASPRESDSVQNRLGVLKNELDKIPSYEQGDVGVEIDPVVGKTWVTVLQFYVRKVTRIERQAGKAHMQTGANTVEDAAERLNTQLHEQLDLPVQSLESIAQEQRKRDEKEVDPELPFSGDEKAEDEEERDEEIEAMARDTHPAPHRGKVQPSKAEPKAKKPTPKGRWNRQHKNADKTK